MEKIATGRKTEVKTFYRKNRYASAAPCLSNCGRAVIGIRLASLAPHDAVCSPGFARAHLFFK